MTARDDKGESLIERLQAAKCGDLTEIDMAALLDDATMALASTPSHVVPTARADGVLDSFDLQITQAAGESAVSAVRCGGSTGMESSQGGGKPPSTPSAIAQKPSPVECCGGGPITEECCGFPIKRPGGSVPLAEIPEEVVVHLALATGPDSAAQKVLDEAAEIRARGRVARFLFDGAGLCVQEGVVMNRADGSAQP